MSHALRAIVFGLTLGTKRHKRDAVSRFIDAEAEVEDEDEEDEDEEEYGAGTYSLK